MHHRHTIRKASESLVHNNKSHQSTTSSFRVARRRSLKQKSSKKCKPDVIFKVIVALEVIFLVCAWSLYSDRLRSSRLWPRVGIGARASRSHVNDAATTTTDDDGYDDDGASDESDEENNDDDDDDSEEEAWERRLRQEVRQRHDKHRLNHAQEQAMRRELARIGPLKEIPEQYRGPTLIIGGSDGSGTRAFAHAMLKLGVPMKIDDKESLDVHGSCMYEGQGWPPLAKSILNVTHSANYELSDLPIEVRETVVKEIQSLKDSFDEWQLKFEQRFFVREKMNQSIPRASGAAIGFKAPVTMLLLPVLQEVFHKGVKYLHIVRDGRDVALSTNKSPVQKFYDSMYSDAEQRRSKYSGDSEPVLAMNLWNDWNTQTLEWEQEHTSDADFDYLVMRSEDLVDPSTKFESLARLAAFVGSPKSLEELCCMSREEEVDMGKSLVSSEVAAGDYKKEERGRGFWSRPSLFNRRAAAAAGGDGGQQGRLRRKVTSDGHVAKGSSLVKGRGDHLRSFSQAFFHGGLLSDDSYEDGDDDTRQHFDFAYGSNGRTSAENRRRLSQEVDDSNIHSRYGKWRGILQEKSELSEKLFKEGAKGLATFGYEPASQWMDPQTSPAKEFVCDERVVCD